MINNWLSVLWEWTRKQELPLLCSIKWLLSLIRGFIIRAGGALEIRPCPVTSRPNLATQIVIIPDPAALINITAITHSCCSIRAAHRHAGLCGTCSNTLVHLDYPLLSCIQTVHAVVIYSVVLTSATFTSTEWNRDKCSVITGMRWIVTVCGGIDLWGPQLL